MKLNPLETWTIKRFLGGKTEVKLYPQKLVIREKNAQHVVYSENLEYVGFSLPSFFSLRNGVMRFGDHAELKFRNRHKPVVQEILMRMELEIDKRKGLV